MVGQRSRRGPRPETLILTLTRSCELRCAYCPTAKTLDAGGGREALGPAQVHRALDLFLAQLPEGRAGEVKLFGGEPLQEAASVEAVLSRARTEARIQSVQVSTNGLALGPDWLGRLRTDPKLRIVLSVDGRPEDHRRYRRALPGVPDVYAHIWSLLPELARVPRLVVTQTIPPGQGAAAGANLEHLRSAGFRRFNLLPGYMLRWSPGQLAELRAGLDGVEAVFRAGWGRGERLALRNLFAFAPTAFFNVGMIVDADGSILSTNAGVTAMLDGLRHQTRVGSLDAPPSRAERLAAVRAAPAFIEAALPAPVLASNRAVDALLSDLVRRLWEPYLEARSRRGTR